MGRHTPRGAVAEAQAAALAILLMRRVLVTGSRDWTDRPRLGDALIAEMREHGELIVVHGYCKSGADKLADEWALLTQGATPERHRADWSLGKHAGHLRNQKMVDLGADVCLAFPTPGSKGTWDCVRRAEAAGIEVKIFAQEQLPVKEVVQEYGRYQPAQLEDWALF